MVRFNKKKHYNFILLASLTNRTYILHDTKGRIQDTYFCNSIFKNVYKYHNILGLGLWCLMPLSTVFQLYQFYWCHNN